MPTGESVSAFMYLTVVYLYRSPVTNRSYRIQQFTSNPVTCLTRFIIPARKAIVASQLFVDDYD